MTSKNENKVVENDTEAVAEVNIEEVVNNEVNEEIVEEVAEEIIEENVEETTEETVEEAAEETSEISKTEEDKTTHEEFISEFAPAPIKIPNYNKEREMRKIVKVKEKDKKLKSKKSKKRRKLVKKIITAVRSVLLFVVLLALITATVSALYVKMNTSEYAVRKAIRDAEPETFVVGEIQKPEAMHLRESSKQASIADILRDNTLYTIAYSDIKGAVMRSSYPDFVAGVAHEIMHFYIFGEKYSAVTKEEIKDVLLDNASHIKLVTDIEVGDTASEEIAEYIMRSPAAESLSYENVAKQKASETTQTTSLLFSTMSLICFVIALLLFIVLTVMFCRGFAYKMIGWSTILSGIICTVAGFLFRPGFVPTGKFIKSVYDAITQSLNQSALVFGGVTVLIGVLVILVGSTINDDDDDEYEEDYIDEIEQIATEQ